MCDVVLPEMTGAELARRLRESRSDLQVLFMSGFTQNAIVHRGVLDPGVELLEKPFTSLALLERVRQVLDRHG